MVKKHACLGFLEIHPCSALLTRETTEVLTDQLEFRTNHKCNDNSMAAKVNMKSCPN